MAKTGDADRRRHYEAKAAHGDAVAMYSLAYLLWDEDPLVSTRWCEEAAQRGNVNAMVGLGIRFASDDPARAKSWYERAVELGDTHAMYRLGRMLERGDRGASRRWLERAAEAGDLDAMFSLGVLLVGTDRKQSLRWLWRAAGGDHPGALTELGMRCLRRHPIQQLRGRGPAVDKAGRLFEKAEAEGFAPAKLSLGSQLFLRGHREEGIRLMAEAAEVGVRGANTQLLAASITSTARDPTAARQVLAGTARTRLNRVPLWLLDFLFSLDERKATRVHRTTREPAHRTTAIALTGAVAAGTVLVLTWRRYHR